MNYIHNIVLLLFLFSANVITGQLCLSPANTFTAGGFTFCVASADFNGDGNPDLVTANHAAGTISLLLGTGTGSFSTMTNFSAGAEPWGLASADLNGDSNADLVVANNTSNEICILLGDGTGGFSTPVSYTVGNGCQSVEIADYNNDGKLDIAGSVKWTTICVLLGDGLGGFSPPTFFPVSSGPLKSADFDKDGNRDLVVCGSPDFVSVLFGNGSGAFSAPVSYTVGGGPSAVTISDFNGDGEKDIATSNYYSGDISVLLGNGTGGFGTTTNFAIGGTWSQAQGIEQVDLNGDKKIDLAVTTTNTHSLTVFLGNGSGSFSAPLKYPNIAAGPRSVISADFNLDGAPDIATCAVNTLRACVFLNKTVIALASSTAICNGETVSLSGAGATSYTWSSGVVNGVPFTPGATSTYTVTGDNTSCPINSNTITVTVKPTPDLTVTASPATVCYGGSSALSVSGAISYTWNTGSSASTITVTPTNTSTYAVTGSSAQCTGTTNISITINPLPSLIVTSSADTLCAQETATLTVSGANTYTWNPGGTGVTIAISPTINTTYTVDGTDGNGCMNTAQFTQIISSCVGIEELKAKNTDVIIYPNPFSTRLTIASAILTTKLQIFDLLGSCVFNSRVEAGKTEINLSSLSSGVYYLAIGQSVKKIIKE